MTRTRIAMISLFVLFSVLTSVVAGADAAAENNRVLHVGKFSDADPADGIPSDWEPLTFEKIDAHTDYRLVDDKGTAVIRAESDASASGLIRKVRIDPRKYPVIQWRWRATGVYEKGDVTQKSGDDYPARVYIAFEYDPDKVGFFERAKFKAARMLHGEYPPTGALTYIWASNAPEGKIVSSAFTDRVSMIVVETGKEKTDTWVSESRNILADYRKAFGEEDPPMIRAIAIMTDSDNTGESTVSYYGDIVMKAAE
ncbi:MAG: DUF3047 domain-containing protein [Desulfobacterales bacterium]|nr:DUF3047 domain-containing protein [Desulfobacterales bacterium]